LAVETAAVELLRAVFAVEVAAAEAASAELDTVVAEAATLLASCVTYRFWVKLSFRFWARIEEPGKNVAFVWASSVVR
jgi:hypothetical protein